MKELDLRKLVQEEIEIKQKKQLLESGYARVANIMRGLVPKIKTFGIITAENPHGKYIDKSENKERNRELVKDLKNMNLGFHKVAGKYGTKENSFMVINIKKKELMELGKKYQQESVIYGEKMRDDQYDGMNFQMINTDDKYGAIMGEQKVFVKKDDAENYYSEVKGRKFQIPFFDEEYQKALFKGGYVDKNAMKEHNLEEIININKTVDKILEDGRTAKSCWVNRGYVKNMVKKINKNNIFYNK
jgi:hypothetical protein